MSFRRSSGEEDRRKKMLEKAEKQAEEKLRPELAEASERLAEEKNLDFDNARNYLEKYNSRFGKLDGSVTENSENYNIEQALEYLERFDDDLYAAANSLE